MERVDLTLVNQILMEVTTSGVPRIDRIKRDNETLLKRIEKVAPEKYANALISFSKEIFEKNVQLVYSAQTELNSYICLLDVLSDIPNDIDAIVYSIRTINTRHLNKLSKLLAGGNSKILKRVQNLKLACEIYCKNKDKVTKANVEKILKEKIMIEISYQCCYFFHIFKENMRNFKGDVFPLGLLLYDLPANPDEEFEILKNLK